MPFSITNYSFNSVVSDISTPTLNDGQFTITGGTFPLFSGQTVSGTNTAITNEWSSPYSTIQLFLYKGDAQIEIYINGSLYSAEDYSSGLVSLRVPVLSATDVININIDEADLPVPSPTPSNTPNPTLTPTATPSVTPTPSATPPPLVWNTYNVNWENANTDWNNA